MEKYLSLLTIHTVFIVDYWGLDARKCPSQDNHLILRTSDGFLFTNERNPMAYTT
jgi:hypothetical protein